MSAALGRFVMAMLHMDDTTLVAQSTSKVGLQSITAHQFGLDTFGGARPALESDCNFAAKPQ